MVLVVCQRAYLNAYIYLRQHWPKDASPVSVAPVWSSAPGHSVTTCRNCCHADTSFITLNHEPAAEASRDSAFHQLWELAYSTCTPLYLHCVSACLTPVPGAYQRLGKNARCYGEMP
jgi:hypothetical protein